MLTRRRFLTTAAGALVTTAALANLRVRAAGSAAPVILPRRNKKRLAGALYFRAQLYTVVPRQVRDDMEWMRDSGMDFVVIGVLEQDIGSARENIDLICAEAHRAGLKVWITPSRWGNLVAGALKVPCTFTGKNPDCWARNASGKPIWAAFGPYASIHHPYTFDNYSKMLRRTLAQWPVAGIIWDEPKATNVIDHSEAAKKAFGGEIPADVRVHRQAFAKFFGRLNGVAKAASPSCHTSMFTYATLKQEEIEDLSDQENLDAFGCDGRPWAIADKGADDSDRTKPATKCLVDDGARFIEMAKRRGKQSIVLVENHALPASSNPIMDRRLPEVIAQGWDIMLCYYYPRSCDEPDTSMAILRKHLLAAGAGGMTAASS